MDASFFHDLEDRAAARFLKAARPKDFPATYDLELIKSLRQKPVDLAALYHALKNGANPNRIIFNGYPALHVAVLLQSQGAVKLLLRHKADANAADRYDMTALNHAERRDGRPIMDMLYAVDAERSDIDPNDAAADYISTEQRKVDEQLARALRHHTVDDMLEALAKGANPNAHEDEGPVILLTATHVAPDKLQALLDAGANISVKSEYGEDMYDLLWLARNEKMLTPAWYAMLDKISQHLPRPLFFRHPDDMTLQDLRAKTPLAAYRQASLLHFLGYCGKIDFILAALKKDPSQKLVAADFTQKAKMSAWEETLLESLAGSGKLKPFLTVDVWQGRIDEIRALQAALDKSFYPKYRNEFEKLLADAHEYRSLELQAGVAKHFHLPRRRK